MDLDPPRLHLWPSELQPRRGMVLPPHQGGSTDPRARIRHAGKWTGEV